MNKKHCRKAASLLAAFLLTAAVILPAQTSSQALTPSADSENVKKTSQDAVIISPVPGTWANYQPLIIDVPEDALVFYSFTGTDPLVSGFAYDGPVLLEVTGSILLRAVIVTADSSSTEKQVSYTVTYDASKAEPVSPVKAASANAYVSITAETPLVLPNNVQYCLSDGTSPYIDGGELAVHKDSILLRTLPLIISDGKNVFRYMLQISGRDEQTSGAEQASDSEKASSDENKPQYPFPVQWKDWNTVLFDAGSEYALSIDGGEFAAGSVTLTLDRTSAHHIRWKKADGSGTAESAVIPAKPVIFITSEGNRKNTAVTAVLSDPRFQFNILPFTKSSACRAEGRQLVSSCVFDTVAGDEIAVDAQFEIYCGGVFHGTISASAAVDKKPPEKPVFKPDVQGFYARTPIRLDISSNDSVFFRLAEPVLTEDAMPPQEIIEGASTEGLDGNSFAPFSRMLISLPGTQEGAVLYKVYAYSQDEAGNKSPAAVYCAVVDRHNYYINAQLIGAQKTPPDGSPSNPYHDFSAVQNILNKKEFARFHVQGSFLEIPLLKVMSETEIICSPNTRLQFVQGGGFIVENSHLLLKGASIEQNNKQPAVTASDAAASPDELFQKQWASVLNGSLELDSCEIVAIIGTNGSVIHSEKSQITVKNTRITGQAHNYGAIITAIDSNVICSGVTFTAIAPTSVPLSIAGGTVIVENSSLTAAAKLGRAAEFSRLEYTLNNNRFSYIAYDNDAGIKKSVIDLDPVWADVWSKQIGDNSNNSVSGFRVSEGSEKETIKE